MVTLTTQQEDMMYEIIHYVKTLVPGDYPLLEFSMMQVYGTPQMMQELLDKMWEAVQAEASLKEIGEIVSASMRELYYHRNASANSIELTFSHPEFEEEVRKHLNAFDRPITVADAWLVTELDLSNFDFLHEDLNCLSHFKNLITLYIGIGHAGAEVWKNFPNMQKLDLVYWGGAVDFKWFSSMKDLRSLCVSGGEISNIDYLNLDALTPLENLTTLILHEFGTVDLSPLTSMPQLKEFALLYANKAINIGAISSLTQLDSLRLADIEVENLDFLDTLPPQTDLEICGLQVSGELDLSKIKRFAKRWVCEIEVPSEQNPTRWTCADLSELEE